MKVVVTGGAGQLGTLVIRRLVSEPQVSEVVSLDIRPPIVAHPKVHTAIGDVRDPEIGKHFTGADAVIHLAFIVTKVMAKNDFEGINVGGSKNVFETAYQAGVRRFVYASSVAAYGVIDRTDLVTEDTPRARDESFAYATCKYDVEAFLDEWEPTHPGVHVARLRPSVLVGTRIEHNLGVALRFRTLPALPQPVPMVWDDDVAQAFVAALLKDAHGAFNLSCDDPLNGEGLARAAELRLVPMPERVVRTTLALSDFLADHGVGVDPAWVRATSAQLTPYDTSRAKSILGWIPACPDGASVIRKYVELAPSVLDPRIRVLLGTLPKNSTVPGLEGSTERIHIDLLGPQGGDVAFLVADGQLEVSYEVPRPPTSVAILKSHHFLDLMAGRTDIKAAESTGRLKLEGSTAAALVLTHLASQLDEQRRHPSTLGERAMSLFSKLF